MRITFALLAACASAPPPAPAAPVANQHPAPAEPLPAEGVSGTIVLGPDLTATPGTAIFVSVKTADAGGNPTGVPLGVAKVTWQPGGVTYDLDAESKMLSNASITGPVVVTARYDQDGDAMTKQPGDLTGKAQVTAPARGVTITLDTRL